ncbi:MAG: hypothetical protein PVSMB7_25620 [Chloroflexota bacterium]
MNGNVTTSRGLGLAAALPLDVIETAARATEQNGYQSFWLNNPPNGSALHSLGSVAASVQSLHLGVGVIPLSHHPADDIVAGVRENSIPLERFYLGIGSGAGSGGVERVREGLRALKGELNGAIVVAALGPRMCALGGAEADGVLLNWLTPDYAKRSVEWIRESAREAGRPAPRIMAYVRTALGSAGGARVHVEAENYERIPAYAAHFDRMGVRAGGTAVTGDTAEDVRRGLAAWTGIVDEVVVRAITANDTPDEILALIETARPQS